MTPLFTATIEQGKLSFVSLQMEQDFGGYLHTLEGKRVTVTVEREKRKRSNQQNRYLWGICYQLIAEYTGEEPEDIHNALRAHFSPKRIVGNIVIPSSTRVLDTVDFAAYVDKVRMWAATELNINIPDPNEVEV